MSALSGLAVRPALGIWTVASATGRQRVCATVEDLADAVSEMAGVDRQAVVATALEAASATPGG
ncbi:hypothetical protein [Aeromicrobium alkaliterrae]|uniref:hypothetical protein n=1 Tax=Aeromicrobium alkaliterrae TaxID=302168 RepID=UPI0031D3D649